MGANPHLYGIRTTRATPPGKAGEEERHGTYVSALGQFEELLDSARVASAASRPLPLFYALSQAGRAISAAWSPEPWKLEGHGLTTPDLAEDSVLDVEVRKPKRKFPHAVDSFMGVAQATGSNSLKHPVSIGELWTSLPELTAPQSVHGWLRPLRVVPDPVTNDKMMPWDRVAATVVGLPSRNGDLKKALNLLKSYPGAAGLALETPQGLPLVREHTEWGIGVRLYWPLRDQTLVGREQLLDRVAPLNGDWDDRWLRPALGEAALSPLLTWWALLFGLSTLARYEPAAWSAALNLDSSVEAAGLVQLLDVAVDRLPELVLRALARPPETE